MRTTPVLIVDDHPLYVDALQLALQPILGRAHTFVAPSLTAAVEVLSDQRVDLVLLDLMLPDAGGLEGIARVRDLAVGAMVVIVSGRSDPITINLARAMGADGFIAKSSSLAEIQNQLRALLAGQAIFPPVERADEVVDAIAALTPAQARVLAAAATGKLNKQIAHEMNLAESTVKTHMSAILKRLGVTNRTQAILAISNGIPA